MLWYDTKLFVGVCLFLISEEHAGIRFGWDSLAYRIAYACSRVSGGIFYHFHPVEW